MDKNNGWVKYIPRNKSPLKKYDSQIVIVISGRKKHYLYLTNKVVELMGNPQFVSVCIRGNNIALSKEENDIDNYTITKSKNSEHPFLACHAFLSDYGITRGVYDAHNEGGNIVFDMRQTPARL